MKLCLMFLLAFVSIKSLAQNDSVELSKLIKVESPSEEKFISFLKANKIDSCLTLISPEMVQKFGIKEIKTELHKINGFFKIYGEPKYEWDWGKPSNNVGTFGHDVRGTIEKESSYTFYNKKGKPVYNFDLFYWNSQNFGSIKYFESHAVEKESYLDAAPSPSY